MMQIVDNHDPITLYIIVRENLDMSMGKLGAQIGHGIQKIMDEFYSLEFSLEKEINKNSKLLSEPLQSKLRLFWDWRNSRSRKVVLKADEKEFSNLKEEFKNNCVVIVDDGLTEIEPNTETVICLWPMHKSQRSKLLKRLQAL